MRVFFTLDEGLAHEMQTGYDPDCDNVASLQRAIKHCVRSKEVMASKVEDIEIYALGVNLQNFTMATPLKPDEKLPKGSNKQNSIFCHVWREKQNLMAEQRRLYANLPKSPEPMEVTVRCSDGKQFQNLVDPRHTISDLKKQFEEESGIQAENQNLSLQRFKLEDSQIAANSGIQNGSIINLEPKSILVHVRIPDGSRMIPVRTKLSHKVKYIKEKVAPETGIQVYNQVLKYNGREVPDNKSAKEVGLKEGSVLDLMPKTVQVYVKTPDGNNILVTMKPSDTIQFIKEDLAPQTGIAVPQQILTYNGKVLPDGKTAIEMGLRDGCYIDLEPNSLQVNVRTPASGTIPVRIKPTDKILLIKEKIAPTVGIKVPQQVLKYYGNELPNAETAIDMGLSDGCIIHLEPRTIYVNVRTPNGLTIPVRIKLSDTIQFIKDEVALEAGIPEPQQILKYKGIELPTSRTAYDMGLTDGCFVDLEQKDITVQVRTTDGNEILVTMKPSDAIKFIMEKVAPIAGIDVHNQILTFQGKVLPYAKTADDMGLTDESIIYLQPRPIQVNVRTPDGDTIPVRMKLSDKIRTIKENIAPKVGIEVPQQVLRCNGQELSDAKTADDMGLTDGCFIDLLPKTIVVNVKTPSGHNIPVTMKPSDIIQFIKEEVAPEAHIPVPQQILKYNGKELPNEKTAEDMGLTDGCFVDLETDTIQVYVRAPDGKTIPVGMRPSDTILFVKEEVAPEVEIESSKQVLKYNGVTLLNSKTAKELGLRDGSILDLVVKTEKKKNSSDDDVDAEGWKSTKYQYDFVPSPFDMSTQMCHYQLGDTVPYYIRINGWEKIGMLKQRILETRGSRNCPYLVGVNDASVLKVFPPGGVPATGKEMGPEETIPNNSSFEVPLTVILGGAPSDEGKKK